MDAIVNCHQLGRICASLLAVLTLSGWIYGQQKAYNKRELLEIVRLNSKDNSMSVETFAQKLNQNGVDFEMTPQDEATFRKAGASNELIDLIRNNFRPARSLVIRSTPTECQVLVDGQSRGATSAAGMLVVRNLVGPHRVTVRKQNYHDDQRTIVVAPNGSVESFLLAPLPGKLNVAVDTDGAHIVVRNFGEYSNSVTNLELPAGSYDVEVFKPGYWPQSKTILIAAGAPYSWPVYLKKMSTEEMIAQASQQIQQRNYSAAKNTLSLILQTEPQNPKASDLMGRCLYFQGQYEEALPYIKLSIARGESLTIPVLQRHGHAANKTFSQARLTLRSGVFEFLSTERPDESFTIPYNKIVEMSLKDDNRHLMLKVKVTLKNKKESQEEYELYSTDAQVGFDTRRGNITSCSQCPALMGFALQLLQQFR